MKCLNLGCGYEYIKSNYKEKWINIDINKEFFKADKYINLDDSNLKLPFDETSIDIICANHILEHIENIIPLMNECYRILKINGIMKIIVPVNEGWFADPTHKRYFNHLTFRYFCDYPFSDSYGITTHFKTIKNEFQDNEDGGYLEVELQK